MLSGCRKVRLLEHRTVCWFHSRIETHQNPKLFPTLPGHQLGENPSNDFLKSEKILGFCVTSQKSAPELNGAAFELQYFRMHSPRFLSSSMEYQNEGNPRTVSVNVLVRSMVSIIQKTDQWSSLLERLCAVSSSKITPSIAVQVLKRIKKPDLAFKFFEWLEDHNGFNHDSLSYSAVLKVLTKGSNPSHASIADALLHKKIDLGFDVTQFDFDLVLQQWVRVGKLDKALGLLDEMKNHGFVPAHSTCSVLLRGLFKSNHKNFGRELFYQMLDGKIVALDTEAFNIVMKVACVEGKMEEALELFSTMKQRSCMPDLDSFNILIKGFCEKGDTDMICSLFKHMLDLRVKPDSYTLCLLIKQLCKQGQPECGNNLFNYMRKVGWMDKKFVYTQLIDSLCNYGWWLKALKIFIKMVRRGHHPTISLYNNLVRRLCMGGRIREAFKLKNLIMAKGFMPDIENYNALMEGVCLGGRMDMAEKLLHEYLHRGLDPDLRTLNVVLRGHCMLRNVTEALELVDKIKEKGWKPDAGSCNSLITSLMMEGKIAEAMQVKSRIQMDQNFNYDTYAVMVNEHSNLNDK